MVIKVENLGTLKTAETDLSKNLIVYSGKNNSGKTYMLNLVYGLMSFNPSLSVLKEEKLRTEIEDRFKDLTQMGKAKYNFNVWDFYEKDNTQFKIIKDYKEAFEKTLKEIFPSSSFISFNFNLTLEPPNNWTIKDIQEYLFVDKPMGNGWYSIIITIPNPSNKFEMCFEVHQKEQFGTLPSFATLINSFAKLLIRNIFYPTLYYSIFNFRLPTFFTSERVASLMFGREIYKYNAQNSLQNFNFDTAKNNTYSKSLLKELEYINNFEHNRAKLSDYSYLADELETLMGGKISANQDGLLLFKEGRTSHLVTNSSSTVKSLATLVFYLRHTAEKGDCIIIDEPELSLHPDNQRKIARFLARCVNEGFKVIISTHSDYIINEINNLITLHKHKNTSRTKSLMKKYDYKDNQTLDYQQVGAYLFKDNHCAKIEVGETGFSVETIDEAMGNLYKASDSIFLNSEVENTKLEPSNNNKDE